MYNLPNQLFTNVFPTTWYGRIAQFPITRIFIAIIFLMPVSLLSQIFGVELFRSMEEPLFSIMRFARDIFFLILFILLYGLYTRYVERREPLELSFPKFFKELGLGVSIPFAAVGFMVALMMVLGYYEITGFGDFINLSDSFRKQMMVGFSEELIFRLILFKLVEEFAGSWWGLIVQGLIFGFAHLGNPNASVWTSIGLVADSTLLLGGAYMLTRRIWLVMGLHWSWNFFQAGVFGMPNSGFVQPSWIQASIEGPEWFTGGAWGIEASYISIAINLIIGLYFVKLVIDNGLLVMPSWKRGKNETVLSGSDTLKIEEG
ncbi:lysostaphin resistance A-like protein [Bacteroidota bacterium]